LPDGTSIVNTASFESTDTGGPHPASAQTTTIVTSAPVLTLSKGGQTQVSAGSQLLYTLSFQNVGTDEATSVVLADQIPAHTTFASATGGGTEAGGVVTWDLAALPAGGGASVNLLLDVDSPLPNGTILTNNAALSSTLSGPVVDQTVTTVLSAPLPVLSKTSTPSDGVAAGEAVTYVLEFRNDGNEDMANAVLTDHVPLGLTPTLIGGGGTFDAATGTLTWNLGTLAAGASGSHTFGILVPVDTSDGTALANIGTLDADNMPAITTVLLLPVTSTPVLELTKDAPPFAGAGGSVSYTLHFENTGNATAHNAELTDILPPETTFATATGTHNHVGGTVTWPLGDLAPGEGGSVTLVGAVQTPLSDGTTLLNTASLSATNAPQTGTTANTTVQSAPALTLSKVGQPEVAAGGQVLYSLAYQNIGTDEATDVALTDILPLNTTFVSATGGGTHSGGIVTWNLGSLPAGGGTTVSVLVNVDSPLVSGTQLINSASIQSNETGPVVASATTTVISSPIFFVSKTASPVNLVQAGQQVVYTIHYCNDGNEDSLNAVLTDLVPSNANWVSNSGSGIWDSGTGLITWDLGLLAAGGSGTETVTVLVPIGTPNGSLVINSATLHGDNAPPASTQVPLLVGAHPILGLTKIANTSVATPGDTIVYTITYQNAGNGLATGAVIIDTVPLFLNFVSASDAGVWNSGARTVTWNLPNLSPGAGSAVTLGLEVDTLTPPSNGASLTNSASFSSNETQPTSASAPVSIAAALLTLTKTGSPEPVQAGDSLGYLFNYSNTGSATATGAQIRDLLAANLIFQGLTGNGSYDPGTHSVTWNLADIPVGGSGSVTLAVQVASPLLSGTVIPNEAIISSLGTSPIRSQTAVNTASSAPTLTLNKVGTPDPVAPGGTLTYTITAENTGNEDAASVLIQDELPVGTQFVSASNAAVYDQNRQLVTWDLGILPAGGGPVSVTLTIGVSQSGGTVTNVARISATGTTPVTATSVTRVGDVVSVPMLSWPGLLALSLLLALLGSAMLLRERLG
jgi:uncharacterized repeat protein (TIGR01451 family)